MIFCLEYAGLCRVFGRKEYVPQDRQQCYLWSISQSWPATLVSRPHRTRRRSEGVAGTLKPSTCGLHLPLWPCTRQKLYVHRWWGPSPNKHPNTDIIVEFYYRKELLKPKQSGKFLIFNPSWSHLIFTCVMLHHKKCMVWYNCTCCYWSVCGY